MWGEYEVIGLQRRADSRLLEPLSSFTPLVEVRVRGWIKTVPGVLTTLAALVGGVYSSVLLYDRFAEGAAVPRIEMTSGTQFCHGKDEMPPEGYWKEEPWKAGTVYDFTLFSNSADMPEGTPPMADASKGTVTLVCGDGKILTGGSTEWHEFETFDENRKRVNDWHYVGVGSWVLEGRYRFIGDPFFTQGHYSYRLQREPITQK